MVKEITNSSIKGRLMRKVRVSTALLFRDNAYMVAFEMQSPKGFTSHCIQLSFHLPDFIK
jgi:hypothetical protein